MMPTDPTALLREMRPTAEHRPDLDDLERILLADPEPPATARSSARYRRPVALAGTLAVVATGAIALAPDGPAVPGVVDRATAAVTKPDTILYFRATTTSGSGEARSTESWQTTDGRRRRLILDGDIEYATDVAAQTTLQYLRETNVVSRESGPTWFGTPGARPYGLADGNDWLHQVEVIGDLDELVQHAKDGRDGASIVGSTTIDGVRAQQIRILKRPFGSDPGPGRIGSSGPGAERAERQTTTRDVYLSEETGLPVRVVDSGMPGQADRVTTFQRVEQLPRTPATERLLQLAPHPGATFRDEGEFH